MTALEVAQRYMAAWNRHDGAAVADSFAAGGTYTDPTVPQGVSGAGMREVCAGFVAAFPDLSFEIVEIIDSGQGSVAVRWIMRGANTGAVGDAPATGRGVCLPGVDCLRVEGDKLRSVQGYYDVATLNAQLGV